MEQKHKITKGDKVKVSFIAGGAIIGIVDYVPCIGGDCWIIIDSEKVYYIQTFEYMQLIVKQRDYLNHI